MHHNFLTMSERKFWKKIRSNKVYLSLTCFVAAILLIILVLYLAVPSYSFDDVEPFKGDYIYNPYSKIERINYFDFRSKDIDNQGINVYEYGYSLTGTRYLCLGYEKQRKIDYPFLQSSHYKQYNIDKLNKITRLVALAHPFKGFRQGQMTRLDHYRVMEALSNDDNSLYYWDIALSNGHRVNIIATGKNHLTACIGDSDAESVYKSLETGNSYAVAYSGNLAEVPQLVNVTVRFDNLFVTVSETAKEMRFIGQNAEVKSVVKNVSKGFYPIQKDDTYIRTEIEFANGNTLYLNPLVRHQYQYFFDLDKAHVMKGRTYLMWAVYVIVAVFLVRMLVVNVISTEPRPKEERNGEIS